MASRSLIPALLAVAASFLVYQYYLNVGSSTEELYKIATIPGKGKGVIAARDIMQGELIMKEEPLFVVKATPSSNTTVEHVIRILQGLNATQRATFYELSNPLGTGHNDTVEAIFQTNSILVGENGAGIFPTIARINHGCGKAFNSVYRWREEEGAGVVHALKPIKKGDEILREYMNTKLPKKHRRQFLEEYYAFECSCSVCSLSGRDAEVSDSSLGAMTTIEQEFRKWKVDEAMDGAEAVRLVKRIWVLGDKAEYWAGRGSLAEDVVEIAAAHHDEKSAKLWAELAAEWYSYERGYDSVDARRMRQLSSDPTKHPSWQKRKELWVGGPDMMAI